MIYQIKWKKAFYLTFAIGIISISTYGIHYIVQDYSDIRQSQASDYTVTLDSPSTKDSLSQGGSFCNPLGCIACAGCVSLQVQQNVEAFPSSTSQLIQTY